MGSDAQSRASTKYNKSRDNIMIRPTKEEGEKIRKAAEKPEKCASVYLGYFAAIYKIILARVSTNSSYIISI